LVRDRVSAFIAEINVVASVQVAVATSQFCSWSAPGMLCSTITCIGFSGARLGVYKCVGFSGILVNCVNKRKNVAGDHWLLVVPLRYTLELPTKSADTHTLSHYVVKTKKKSDVGSEALPTSTKERKDLQGFTVGFDLQPGSLAAQPAGEHQP